MEQLLIQQLKAIGQDILIIHVNQIVSAEKWLVNGEYRMGIFAKRDLDVDEEITIDYRFETFGDC